MERERFEAAASVSSQSINGSASTRIASLLPQPDYSCKKVQESLKHLACIDLTMLCNEAKVERCRAARDLRSCGRFVQSMLNSCGHASLCEECSQRCDSCPICRISIPKNGNRLCLRLYYKCIEAGLIPKGCDDRFQEKEEENHLIPDVQRLYSLFDVALENNLVALICHYVTDVCMDERAVSSDPVIAFLLDEVVVKDWCKRTFKNILSELQVIYNFTVQEMRECLMSLSKFSVKLAGILNVLDALESSFKGSLSAQLHDLNDLHDRISKTKQHLEVISWCIRHDFLENVKSRWHGDFTSWRSVVHERKNAAIERAWPCVTSDSSDSIQQDMCTLFIEDALSNLDTKQEYNQNSKDEADIACLKKDGDMLYFQSKIEGMAKCYPFENVRAATDLLFLNGRPDLVVAKQAIFLYYLFDRHWKMPDEEWRVVVDDFAATFGITRHSLLESFTFYLLDDHSDEALQEACHLLPEISGRTTHPKVARVLLDRQNPDGGLMVLRWSGQDGVTQLVSLDEAVTAVRIRVECGLLTEAFMFQRMLCTKVKENKVMSELTRDGLDGLKDEYQSWENWLEALVTEICFLCIRRDLVDRMIELPWNCDEEKYLHRCLFDFALEDPSKTTGSLLVVFYLQRHRYIEAYQVDRKLQNVEQDFLKNSMNEELLSRMTVSSQRRSRLVDRSVELLPEVQQQLLKAGKLPEVHPLINETEIQVKADLPIVQEPILTSLLVPPLADSSMLVNQKSSDPSSNDLIRHTPSKLGLFASNYASTSISHSTFSFGADYGRKLQHVGNIFNFDNISTPGLRRTNHITAPLQDFNKSSPRALQRKNLQDDLLNELSPEREQNGFSKQFQSISPYSQKAAANTLTSSGWSNGMFKEYSRDSYGDISDERVPLDSAKKTWNIAPVDFMDISSSREQEGASVVVKNKTDGYRWRSDDGSEEEEQPSPDGIRERSIRTGRRSRLIR